MVTVGTGSGNVTLAEPVFAALFPFYFAFGPDGVVTRTGPSLQKMGRRPFTGTQLEIGRAHV